MVRRVAVVPPKNEYLFSPLGLVIAAAVVGQPAELSSVDAQDVDSIIRLISIGGVGAGSASRVFSI
jgi:hypothetical protein